MTSSFRQFLPEQIAGHFGSYRQSLAWGRFGCAGQQGQESVAGDPEPASEARSVSLGKVAGEAPEPDESLTSEQIVDLVSKLRSPDDTVRNASEETLGKGYHVSKIGAGPVLELMEAIGDNYRSKSDPQAGYVGTVLESAVNSLIQDDPDLVGDWIEQANQAGEAIPESLEALCFGFTA